MISLKKMMANETVRNGVARLAALYIRFVRATGSWTVVGGDNPGRLWDRHEPFILAFWHGRILMTSLAWRPGVPMHMLISQHRDGLFIAKTITHFGLDTMAGSSRRGGTGALRGMIRMLKSGLCIGMTPDGPKGPRMHATEGIAHVSCLTGAPVVPHAFSAKRGRIMASWDRFFLAWPFSSGVFVWGEPLYPPDSVTPESRAAFLVRIEAELNRVTREADLMMGRSPVEPAPLSDPGDRNAS